MHENVFKIYSSRIRELAQKNFQEMYPETRLLKAEFACTAEPVPFKDRLKLKYSPITEGTCWGKAWDSAWFHITGTVPESFAGKEICLKLNVAGEIMIFDDKGIPVYGLTDSSVFDTYFHKDRFVLPKMKAGEKIDVWFEAAANGLFGIQRPAPDDKDPAEPNGSFHPVVNSLRLCIFDRELWLFMLEMETITILLDSMDMNDYRAKQLQHCLSKAVDIYNYTPANAAAARKYLQETAFQWKADSGALMANSIGHAHIDIAWLWPLRESTRKAARTYSSQISLMKEYPDYKFGASQPYLYEQVKENYPGLYKKVKKAVRDGRWEPQGGMYVEADCNLISGESMVRQFLYGKNFFMDEFGVNVRNLWLPDVFGYSAAMPQILRKAGCDYFLTQKISWSQINKFPYHTFRWHGVDGSEVLTHFLPENDYNAPVLPITRIQAANRFNEADILPGFMSLVGIGDGGGGPCEHYVERARILSDMRGCPKSQWRFASSYFDEIQAYAPQLPEWTGELYLEFHRGTLTTQSRTKRGNRKSEQALTALEMIASCLPAKAWPRKQLTHAWKDLLKNQFHDIIPGSSIGLVYERTEREHKEILAMTDAEIRNAAAQLFRKNKQKAVLANTLSYPWTGIVELPESWKGFSAADEQGNLLPAQEKNGKTFVYVTVPGNSFVTITQVKKAVRKAKKVSGIVLENDLIRYEFNKAGRLIRAYDKECKRDILCGEGNVLNLYHDRPLTYDAWDVDIYYPRDHKGTMECVSATPAYAGGAGTSAEFVFRTDASELRQTVVLAPGSKRLDFITHADWHESRTMLRTSFAVDVHSDKATFDIQYAHLERPTHRNTSWDQAKFETCGQRYADLSNRDFGVALLNDCKYGYCVKDSMLDLALLRSPKHPDWFADQGEHTFTYSFLPHNGMLTESTVMQEAACLNRSVLVLDGFEAGKAKMPCSITADGITIEVLKRAEKDDSLILRLVETKGRFSTGTLNFNFKPSLVVETDLMEWNDAKAEKVVNGKLALAMKPFEIKTYRIR